MNPQPTLRRDRHIAAPADQARSTSRSRFALTHWRRDRLAGLGFVAPQMIGFAIFVLGPIIAVFWFSLHDWNLVAGNFDLVGPGNYAAIVDDPLIGTVARNSLVFALAYVPTVVLLGLLMALALNRALAGISVFRTIYFLPVVVSLVAWTIVWRFLLNAEGGINALLQGFGIEGPNWLRQPTLAMGSVVLIQILKNAGLNMVLFLAALQGVPRDLIDAAKVDGTNDRQAFRHVTLPLITPFVFLALVLAVITSLKSFSLIFLTTGGGPGDATLVLAYYIYDQAFQSLEMGYASALAVTLFVAVLVLTVVQFVIRRRWVVYED